MARRIGLQAAAAQGKLSALAVEPGASLVLHNGKVLTVDARFSTAQAVAIDNGRITAVGSDAEVRASVPRGARLVDLHGATVLPGLHDAHAHMDREGLKFLYPSLAGARSIGQVLERIAAQVARARPGDWIVMMPIGDPPDYHDVPGVLAEKRFPTARELDIVSPANPVYIRGIWGYWNRPPITSIANSLAMKLAGITRDTSPPHEGVVIERDALGEPTGVFVENEFVPTLEFTLFRTVPRFDHAMRVAALRDSMRRYNAAGTTTVYEGHGVADETVAAYRELHGRGELTVRSHLVVSPTPDGDLVADYEAKTRDLKNDDFLTLDGVFVQADGKPEIARLLKAALPYTGWGSYHYDAPSPERLRAMALAAARRGIRVNTIAPTRKALEEMLALLEDVNREVPLAGRRWVVSHVGPSSANSVEILKRLDLFATGIPSGTVWKAAHLRELNPPHLYAPYRSIVDAGVPFALATDNVPISPFFILWCAVARRRQSGEVLVPGQRLTREQALRAMTIDAARLCLAEKAKGSIEPGKLADLAVIREDYLSMAEEELHAVVPRATLVGGRVVAGEL